MDYILKNVRDIQDVRRSKFERQNFSEKDFQEERRYKDALLKV